MPEIPNVVTSEDIESEWGNDIRDRVIQRYPDIAGRSSEHPTPAAGDLAYMEDTGLVYVYHSGAWKLIAGPEEVENGATFSGSTTGSYATIGSVSLTIPTYWDSWKCVCHAQWVDSSGSTGTYNVRMSIDGTAQTEYLLPIAAGTVAPIMHLIGRRSGMVTTGARTIAIQSKDNTASTVAFLDGLIIARAIRTA
jgi:hypothetical protein